MSNRASLTASNTTPKICPPLELPSPSPRVGINDPGFVKLTTAEKLNDSRYRELVYQNHPNEPTCACETFDNEVDSRNSAGNCLVCRSGCGSSCCWRMRQSFVASDRRYNANKDDKVVPFIPAYCVGNKRENVGNAHDENDGKRRTVHNGDYCCVENRLRGGGEGGGERGERGVYSQSGKVSGTTIRLSEDAWNGGNDCVVERRLDGGGGIGFVYAERHPLNRSLASDSRGPCFNEENLHREYPTGYSREHGQDSNLYTRSLRSTTNPGYLPDDYYGLIAAGCCCPGKEMVPRATGQSESNETTMKPLTGVDCLVKALRETQEFVESLGKVPGLAGLGLMDPAESPYFGRIKAKESNADGTYCAGKLSEFPGLPNPQCTGPCNAQMLSSNVGGTDVSSFGATPFTIAVPGRGGIVREAVPSMPGPGFTFVAGKSPRKSIKKDDKDRPKETDPSVVLPTDVETGPCGEPGCGAKLRRNVAPEDPSPVNADEIAAKKIVTLANINNGMIARTSNKMKAIGKIHSGRRSSEMSGHGAYRNGRKRSSGRGFRRAMSFVYSAGDNYSGNTRGHKNCIEERHRVPGNMGWLWNLNEQIGRLKPRQGWRPGAIGRHLREILREGKANLSYVRRSRLKSTRSSSSHRSRSRSLPSRGKRSKVHGDRRSVRRIQSKNIDDDKEEIEPPPTLHIHRKDGTYYVTMYPIKQDIMDVPKLEEPMKPLQFKIAKNKDDGSIASSSTASDMEIEFSPPAAVNRYRKKPDVIHVDTQVKQQEIMDAFKSGDAVKGVKTKEKKKGKKGKK